MAQIGVGSFATPDRRAIRSYANPMDKCTVVSIMKRGYTAYKYTLEPGSFTVPAGSLEKPGILSVGSASWFLDTDPDRPIAEIVTSSIDVARSVVEDYVNGLVGYQRDHALPGVFYVMGDHNQESVIKKFKPELDRANLWQRNWYQNLVNLADELWARSNGNPSAISEDYRLAASELGLEKPWMATYTAVQLIKCVLCGNLRDPNYAICANCNHIIDVEMYNKLNVKKLDTK